METVSENNKRRRFRPRGRPRKYEGDRWRLEEFERYESDPRRGIGVYEIHGVRQQQNIILAERVGDYLEHYYESSEGVLSTDSDGIPSETTERYDIASHMSEVGHDVPQRVMTELGRHLADDEESFWRALLWYLDYPRRLRAESAARIMREFRLGQRTTLPGE
jgi:hypothetical protein